MTQSTIYQFVQLYVFIVMPINMSSILFSLFPTSTNKNCFWSQVPKHV